LKDKWISVKDRLPDRERNVLGYFPNEPPIYEIRVIRFVPADEDTEAFFVPGIDDLEAFPSHWMKIKRPL
jgi:hypothetical protein